MCSINKFIFPVLFFLNLISVDALCQINPQTKFKGLFEDVQTSRIFKDQKKFVDCDPKVDPDSILRIYNEEKGNAGFNLRKFVGTYFDTIQNDTVSMLRHIHYLWSDLTKQPKPQKKFSSLLALPYPYIVPGGRFKEIYYWDSYFTMLGLQQEGKVDLIEDMVNNFAYLIRTYGHIPNGNRTYYLSRSQPPFFAMMVQLLAETKNDNSIYVRYLNVMEKEYNYWISGKKVVRLGGNDILNRYWDRSNLPRPEAYLHDVGVFRESGRDSSVFRDLRSAAESGWDFSSRWFEDGSSLDKIITTQFVPVDLNCLLYKLEIILSKAYLYKNDNAEATAYAERAAKRKMLILKYFWDNKRGFFFDYNVHAGKISTQFTLAGLFPLFCGLAGRKQAEKVLARIRKDFLKPGGLVTTLVKGAGQQWDYPNGWAPLQWIGYVSCKNYHDDELAAEIARRWTNLNIKVYFETGKMMEKYDVVDINRPGGGGEYPNQDGFGWTNGVFLKLWNALKNSMN